MRLRALVVAVVVAGISAAVFAQGPRRDGKWEVKTEMQMPGMQMPPTTTTQCITPADAADPTKSVPQAPAGRGARGPADPSCKVADYKVTGNKVNYTMKCEGAQPMTMNAELTYGVDTYDGMMTLNVDRGGQPTTINIKMSGKRLGDCDGK
jgi:Protein of unknown function (DUF3617)